MNDLFDQMVSDISSQAVRLDELRLHLFLNWLTAHNSTIQIFAAPHEVAGEQVLREIEVPRGENFEEHLKSRLRIWFGLLPIQGALWEYHLLLNEISWWRDLDPRRLNMIQKSEAGR